MLDSKITVQPGFRSSIMIEGFESVLETKHTSLLRSDTQIGIPGKDGAFAISAEPDNQIKRLPDGAYVPPTSWASREW